MVGALAMVGDCNSSDEFFFRGVEELGLCFSHLHRLGYFDGFVERVTRLFEELLLYIRVFWMHVATKYVLHNAFTQTSKFTGEAKIFDVSSKIINRLVNCLATIEEFVAFDGDVGLRCEVPVELFN